MTEFVLVNGHMWDCAYVRSLDDLDGYEPCDCKSDDDDWEPSDNCLCCDEMEAS